MLQTKVNVLFENIFNFEKYFVAIKTLKKPIKVDKKTKKRNLNLHADEVAQIDPTVSGAYLKYSHNDPLDELRKKFNS